MATDDEGTMSLPDESAVLSHSARSDVGRVRQVNEDAVLAEAPVYVVADGMGGHARGDAASRAALDTFRRHLDFGAPVRPEQVLDAIHTANTAVRALSAEGEEGTAVAGTTLAGVALVDAGDAGGLRWMAFNVGDSRIYAWDGRRLEQVSVDHSAVQELVDAGVISADEAERHPDRNVITRALGADDWVDPDVWLLPATGRQVFLLCTDGLTKELGADQIAGILAAGAHGSAGELVDAAVARGGRDNVSVVVIESQIGSVSAGDDETTRDRPDEATAPRPEAGA
ncbi:PP2C family protein-serine/threonine phosphatase [Agromyces larvae]|uniref:Protein phosphatase 2C domain-containing protein n=1 Tax=Agromyces larvae TaxID=2929802 RepID=A0ABY4C342_9MICO|nr:protein phosphatase 2C domain-containing protein [Agromyces larvae]UOE45419.1 protein phosphatase 2C domain-containing protein [Agromyces larvae]